MNLTARDDHGAQGEGHVHAAVVGDVAETAAVGAAPGGFEFVDDFHGADLGGAADGAHGLHAGQRVQGRPVVPEGAGDAGDDVHDVAVAFDGEGVVHADAAVAADLSEVVAAQVDEHEVFGAFLLVGQEFGGLRVVVFGGGAARAGAGDGAGGDRTAVAGEQALGAAGDQRDRAELQVPEVRAGVHAAQGAVQREGVQVAQGRAETLAGHHLEDVSGADVLQGAVHGVAVGVGREVAGEGGGGRGVLAGHVGQRAAQALHERGDLGVGVGLLRGGGDGDQAVLEVVEDDHAARRDEAGVGHAEFVGVAVGQGLVRADQVVRGVPDRPADQGGQPGRDGGGAGGGGIQVREGIGHGAVVRAEGAATGDVRAARLEAALFAHADERVPAEFLARLDALEEEGDGFALRGFQVRGDGRVEVGVQFLRGDGQRGAAGLGCGGWGALRHGSPVGGA